MNKFIAASTAVALVGSTTFAIAQNQLETTLDLMLRGMIEEGADISYDQRIVGEDESVEYKNLIIVAPEEEVAVTIDWIKGTPSEEDPSFVTFTVSDTIIVSGIEEGVKFDFQIQSSGLEFTTNGLLREALSTEDVIVDFAADEFVITGGEPDSENLRNLYVDMGSVDFDLLVSDAQQIFNGSFEADKLDVAYDFTAEGQTQVAEQSTQSISVAFEADLPNDEKDALGFLDGSKSAAVQMSSGTSEFTTSVEAEGIIMDMAGTSGASSAEIKMIDGTLTYDVTAEGFEVLVTPGGDLPVPPIEIGMGEMGMKVVLPANSADIPSEVVVDILFKDIVVGEDLWSMIDPGQTISRDPAQIDIDLEAMVQFDAMAAIDGVDPASIGTIHSVDISQILLAIAGASIQAGGAATFDNTGSVPLPLGTVNIEFNGVSTLTNQLVALGLLDQMQAGMALGMMMAFGVPGDEVDQFLSEITFTEEGVLANGQPIQ